MKIKKKTNKVLVDEEMLEILYNGGLLKRVEFMDHYIKAYMEQLTSSQPSPYTAGVANGMLVIQGIINNRTQNFTQKEEG